MTTTLRFSPVVVSAKWYENSDDPLAAAANEYVRTHPELEEWYLNPRWGDAEQETILLDIPDWFWLGAREPDSTSSFDVNGLSSDELNRLESAIHARRAVLAGTGLTIWTQQDGTVEDCPDYGAVLSCRWAHSDQDDDVWYPTVEAALAALDAIARGHGRLRAPGDVFVDLTSPGCHSSEAWVQNIPAGLRQLR